METGVNMDEINQKLDSADDIPLNILICSQLRVY
jgi:hypothetical protein